MIDPTEHSISSILDWIRTSREPSDHPKAQAPTKGGYQSTYEGMTEWVEDVISLLGYVADKDINRYNDFMSRCKVRDPIGFNALVGSMYHTESQQEEDVTVLVPTTTVPAVTVPPTTTIPVPTTTVPTTTTVPPPTTTVPPPTTTVPPPTTTVPPVTTTVPPPTTTTRPEEPSSIWPKVPPIQHAPFPLPGRGDLAGIPHADPLVEGRATALMEGGERPQRLRPRPIAGLPMQEMKGRPETGPLKTLGDFLTGYLNPGAQR